MAETQALIVAPQRTLLPAAQDWQTMCHMAKVLHESGLVPNTLRTWQAVLAVVQKGNELGLPPMQALSSIYVIGGKPACYAELMLALIYRDHGDDAARFDKTDDAECLISYKRRGWKERLTYRFTMAEAVKAGLKDGNWSKWPAAMLRARCISAVARMAFPDTIGGMHTPDELGAEVRVNESGVIEVAALPAQDAPKQLTAGNGRSPAVEPPIPASTLHYLLAAAAWQHDPENVPEGEQSAEAMNHVIAEGFFDLTSQHPTEGDPMSAETRKKIVGLVKWCRSQGVEPGLPAMSETAAGTVLALVTQVRDSMADPAAEAI